MAKELEPKTAISYRREDSSGWARALYDRLIHTFGESYVFIDFDGIGSGDDFESKIATTINASDALLALIGRRWLDIKNENGGRRLDDAHDTVRFEIRAGLGKGLVIPVLVDGADMPKTSALPTDIQKLGRLNAHVIGLKTFHRDVDDLTEEIRLQTKLAREKRESVSPEASIRALEHELAQARAELDKRSYQSRLRLFRVPWPRPSRVMGSEARDLERNSKVRRGEARPQREEKPFDAFLVYSHREGGRLAAVLQKALETYPAVGGRKLHIFRDTTDLAASPSLLSNLREMIDNSEFLIFLASPAAAQSRWVEAELSYFLQSRPRNRVLMVLAEGDLESSMPASLGSAFGSDMPLFVDFRGLGGDSDATRSPDFRIGVARLVAGLRGMALDDVLDRRGYQRRRRRVVAILVFVVVVLTVTLVIYWGLTSR